MPALRSPRVTIEYCTQCRWMLRAAWMAQEILTTFGDVVGEVALQPGTGGVFRIHADDTLIWCREQHGGFPDLKVLKQRLRDVIAPDMDLGHSDRRASTSDSSTPSSP